jgi:RNA polymerase sigma-70 factor, ECF subfamily
MNHSSNDLLPRMMAGDPSSFRDAIAWYADDVLRLSFFLLRDRCEAEDVLQETMLRLTRQAKRGELRAQNGSLKGFLLRCARNLCIDRLRKTNRLRFVDDEESGISELADVRDTPDRVMEQTRLQNAFEEALEQLSDAHRVSFVLFELHGESYKEIAETLGVSIEAVKKNLFRARRKLRLLLAPYRELS